MQKVRVKKAPKKGDQVAFGLISNLVQPLGRTSGEKEVSSTMRAIPRNEANVEVEGGETVIGDTNNDGLMELFSFEGKRHSEGGMPVNLPPGSFIYSDTAKLRIKDKEVLTKIFGMPFKKGGYTPAQISKKYQINKYIETIKDKDADALSKRSASEMIKKNTEKLGVLALVQESMKGFPDGIPSIAESVMAGLQGGQPQGEMPQADFGGWMPLALRNGGAMRKYQVGSDVKASANSAPPIDIYSIGVNAYNTIKGLGNDAWNYEGSTNRGPDGKPVACVDCDIAGSMDWNNPKHIQDLNRLIEEGYAYGTEADAKRYEDALSRFNLQKPVYASRVPQQRYGGYLPKAQDGMSVDQVRNYVEGILKTNDPKKIREAQQYIKAFKPESHWYDVFSQVPGGGSDWHDYYATRLEEKAKSLESNSKQNSSKDLIKQKVNELYPAYKADYDKFMRGEPTTILTPQNAAKIKNIIDLKSFIDAAENPSKIKYTGNLKWKPEDWYNPNKIQELSNSIGISTTPATTSATTTETETHSETGAVKRTTPQQTTTESTPTVTGQYKSQAEYFQHLQDPYSPEKRAREEAWRASKDYVPVNAESIAANPQWRKSQASTQSSGRSSSQAPGQTVALTVEEWLNQKREGGALGFYQKAGEVHNGKKIKSVVYLTNGIGVIYEDGTKGVYSQSSKDISTYDQKRLDEWKAKGIEITLPKQIASTAKTDIVPGMQHTRKDGTYGTEDYGSPEYLADFKERFPEFIKQNPNYDPTKKQDVGKYQDWYNEDLRKQATDAGYTDPAEIEAIVKEFGFDATQGLPNSRDEMFGRWSATRPKIKINKKPEPTPESDTWYYCLNGTVTGISVPKGETPTPPSGATGLSKDRYTAEVACMKAGEELTPEKPKDDTWMMPDIVNFIGALSQKYAKTTPVQQKYVSQTPGYDLMDPTRQLAANQEQMAQMRSQAENTVAGNVGLASMLGASGKGFANAADILANTERQNIGIVNQAYDRNAQIKNQEAMLNENARGQYAREIAQKQQADTLAENTKNAMVRDAFNTGWSNFTRDQMMEKVLFPQVHTNNLTGEVSFSGKGREYDEPNTYSPAYGTAKSSATPEQVGAYLTKVQADLMKTPGMTQEQASEIAKEMTKKFLNGDTASSGIDYSALLGKKYGGRSGLMPIQPMSFNDYFAF